MVNSYFHLDMSVSQALSKGQEKIFKKFHPKKVFFWILVKKSLIFGPSWGLIGHNFFWCALSGNFFRLIDRFSSGLSKDTKITRGFRLIFEIRVPNGGIVIDRFWKIFQIEFPFEMDGDIGQIRVLGGYQAWGIQWWCPFCQILPSWYNIGHPNQDWEMHDKIYWFSAYGGFQVWGIQWHVLLKYKTLLLRYWHTYQEKKINDKIDWFWVSMCFQGRGIQWWCLFCHKRIMIRFEFSYQYCEIW